MTSSLKIRMAAAAAAALMTMAVQPAAAQQFAFGFSSYDNDENLVVTTTTGTFILDDNAFQGWVDNFSSNTGGPDGNNNYAVGINAPGEFLRNYFGFDISSFGGHGEVTAVALEVSPFTINTNFTYNLYNASGLEGSLHDATSPNGPLYNAMASGDNLGSFALTTSMSGGAPIEIPLDSTAVADLNAALNDGQGFFVIAGSVTPNIAPEPATWALMLIGFAGLGAAVRRRRATANATV